MSFDDALFDRLYPRLVRYGWRLTGDRDEAEDVAQEAFVRMVQREISGSEDGMRVWLFRTALNLIRDRARVRSNRERLLEENLPAPPSPDTPEEVAERRGAVARARTALDSLGPRDREILLLRQEGFKYREIAEAVEVAPSSVGTLLARAQRRFAETYRRLDDGDDAPHGR
ncbi:MAG: sigma-70 family RNA polymerase sigma factor [Gemmatimonadetes bacterium]|nr:sigma-70 family RNA polymerase sigma factor [Gemmatimonadota bacterium]NIR79316.1 sigma-70 family RNA polymerase sigma factor [Gemmatimonadota bacterium]NIT87972.1 sigma-70 family RNA polymerase sigma factor [Gemmatimonadota bacterium]NIU31823.1 sigma-70 family RNA polymerase sigma factor [Gemmatimonadota bacterium]NIU36442.1 sigma-70 family RNA polymerase sigma factor [Gemmatimonadota bacterium]